MYRSPWTATEDKILSDYIKTHGEGGWSNLPTKAGLKRCGDSCRQRWLNYLRPDIKKGNISSCEEELIIRLHKLLGNSWSSIARRLPGRTAKEIKSYWTTNLAKKILDHSTSSSTRKSSIESKEKTRTVIGTSVDTRTQSQIVESRDEIAGSTDHCKMDLESGNGFLGWALRGRNLSQNYEMDCSDGENCCFSEFSQLWDFSGEKTDAFLPPTSSDGTLLFLDAMLQNWTGNDIPSDIQSLASVVGSEKDWLKE
ncbi:hypothetical protein MKW94_011654 [Papaver nudicaule]|uniref:Uncharacterized protein n=1 Tax=Papaver nudicaule TaxID=74823 RepID=A0AA41VD05_PAPNU|nr:hypothetical protein [Papaver nudicaule]